MEFPRVAVLIKETRVEIKKSRGCFPCKLPPTLFFLTLHGCVYTFLEINRLGGVDYMHRIKNGFNAVWLREGDEEYLYSRGQ